MNIWDGAPARLVKVRTPSGTELDGMLFGNEHFSQTVVHVHGSLGNFYQNRFISVMGRHYAESGIRLLSFNLSAHDGVAEGYRHTEEFEYTGGSLVDFRRCTDDIEGAVTFAESLGGEVTLQGHSMGCDRILDYVVNGHARHDCILLGPCDSYRLQEKWIAPETVEQQVERLKRESVSTAELDWLPAREYGIRSGDEDYVIPITRKALLSIMEGPVFRLLRLDSPTRFRLERRAFVYLGGKDPLQTADHESMFKHLEERVAEVTRFFVAKGGHSLERCEEVVAERIVAWLSARGH